MSVTAVRHSLLVPLVLAVATSAAAAETETIDRSYPFAPDGVVAVENVNGGIDVEAWDRPEVTVRAVKTASTVEELRWIEVEIDASADRLVVETRHRSGGWSWKRLTEGLFGGRERSVSYSLKVPRRARLESVESVNGPVTVDGVVGAVRVTTVNGPVRADDVAGEVEVETVNGRVEIALARAGTGDRVTVESVNGSVSVELPESANVEVAAESVNGRITTNCALEVVEHRYVGRELSGTLGTGAGAVTIETVNGRIDVRLR